jgi:hypothetical protein
MATRWMCYGEVRGTCGVRHLSREDAEACCAADQRSCRKGSTGACSDRYPYRVGEGGYLEAEDGTRLWTAASCAVRV